ncbi:hypothetical protein F5144DRAFT_608656 [Chaetomium tenue]|uniref:Uncharacterized protein n=1 Tax=Chaetomium tenue TaxID=1854479 RepID=A0ACB7PR44_9PEZI|nr:hypothetical protein F5144DRAFT_608656 [Chaetomium globosum]
MYQAGTADTSESGKKQEQSSPFPLSNYTLELLPTEVLVAILSAVRSTADLHALIHASPRLYQVFMAAKREVLLSIVATDLGNGLRDAIAALRITPSKLETRETASLEDCERIIRRYEALPHHLGQLTSASELAMDTVIALSQLNRTVQFFVDEFAESRLPELRKIHPDAANPLTPTERRRLSQALLRHQALAHLEHGNRPRQTLDGAPLAEETAMTHRFLHLFRPWAAEQLAEAHGLVTELVSCAFPHHLTTALRLMHPERPKTARERRRDAALYDLAALRAELVAERARAVPVADDPSPWRRRVVRPEPTTTGRVSSPSPRFPCLAAGPLPAWDPASYRVRREGRGLRDALYQREDRLPPLVPAAADDGDEDDAAPPFAWVDAHGGLDCQRWGGQVRREARGDGEDDTTGHQRIWVRENVNRWRWLGFVFWDRARVELLKMTPRTPAGEEGWLTAPYETGWLAAAPPADEELRERYERSRPPQRMRSSRRANATRGGGVLE